MRIADVIFVVSTTADFGREHPGLLCMFGVAPSIAVGYFIFRRISWRQFLDQSPLFLVTGGAFFLMSVAALPEALPKPFEWYLGHPIYAMVYEHQSSGTVFGELWTNRWWERIAGIFDLMVLGSAIWAIVNLSLRRAVRSNGLALLFVFGWLCLIVWATSSTILF